MRLFTVAPLARSLNATSTFSTLDCTGAASAATAFGMTVMTGMPRTTSLTTWNDPATTDWVVRTTPPSATTSTASVTRPLPRRTATRAATSLPSGPEVTRTAAGSTRWAMLTSTSALGTERNCSISGAEATYTVVAPCSPSVATTSSVATPHTTALGSPSRRARA